MPLTAEQLSNFLEDLRNRRGAIEAGDQQYLAAFELISTLVARAEWPAGSEEWRMLLAPVLASSPAQQAAFYEQFDACFGRKQADPARTALAKAVREQRVRSMWAAAAIVLLACGLWSWKHFRTPAKTLVQSQATPTQNTAAGGDRNFGNTLTVRTLGPGQVPLSGVTVRMAGETGITNSTGSVVLRDPAPQTGGFWALATREGLRPAVDVLMPGLRPLDLTMDAFTVPPRSGWRRFFYIHYQLLRSVAAALPFLGLIGYSLSLLWRHLKLRKWSELGSPAARQLAGRTVTEQLFPVDVIRRIARDLRRRKPGELLELAIAPTVESTARQGGYFTPVLSRRFETPEYLVLAERKNRRDHLALYYDELNRLLDAEDVSVERFYFRGDPRVCVSASKESTGLGELTALYDRRSLILCLDQRQLLDPVTGEPEAWAAQLAQWRERALLTPSPDRTELGFRDAGAGIGGLEALAEITEYARTVPPLPALIESDVERWLDPGAPPPALVARLAADLRLYLEGEGYLLLAACAVYPGIEWQITTLLAAQLVAPENLRSVFERLIQLPWFRYGAMPDWLRRRLLGGLSEPNQRRVRSTLEALLKRVTVQAKPDAMDVVIGPPRSETGAEPVRDHVFLDFMSGRRIDPLDFAAPHGWRKWMRTSMLRKAAVAAIGGVILSAGAFAACSWVYGKVQKRVQSPVSAPVGTGDLAALAVEVSMADLIRAITPAATLHFPPLSSTQYVLDSFEVASEVLDVVNPLPSATDGNDLWSKAANVSGLREIPAGSKTETIKPGMIAVVDGTNVAIVQEVENGNLYLDVSQEKRIAASSVKIGFIDVSGAVLTPRILETTAVQPVSKGWIAWTTGETWTGETLTYSSDVVAKLRQAGYTVQVAALLPNATVPPWSTFPKSQLPPPAVVWELKGDTIRFLRVVWSTLLDWAQGTPIYVYTDAADLAIAKAAADGAAGITSDPNELYRMVTNAVSRPAGPKITWAGISTARPNSTLLVEGSGFVSGAMVLVDAKQVSAIFNNAGKMLVANPPANGTVVVRNPDGTQSNAYPFGTQSADALFEREKTDGTALVESAHTFFVQNNYPQVIRFLTQAKAVPNTGLWKYYYPYLAAAYDLTGNRSAFQQTLTEMVAEARQMRLGVLNFPDDRETLLSELKEVRGVLADNRADSGVLDAVDQAAAAIQKLIDQAPRIDSLQPDTIPAGKRTAVTLTGHFPSDSTLSATAGVTVESAKVSTAQISATLYAGPGATDSAPLLVGSQFGYDTKVITISPATTNRQTAPVAATHTLKVHVVDAVGQPVPGAWVWVGQGSTTSPQQTASSAGDTSFDLPNGTYQLNAATPLGGGKAGHGVTDEVTVSGTDQLISLKIPSLNEPQNAPNTQPAPPQNLTATVDGGAAAPKPTAQPPAPTHVLTIHVEDALGRPLAGAEVRVADAVSKLTSPSGDTEVNLPDGVYTVAVARTGFTRATASVKLAGADQTVTIQISSVTTAQQTTSVPPPTQLTATVSGAVQSQSKGIEIRQHVKTPKYTQDSKADDISKTWCGNLILVSLGTATNAPGSATVDASTVKFVADSSSGEWTDSPAPSQNGAVCFQVNTVHHATGKSGKVTFHFEYDLLSPSRTKLNPKK